MYTEWNICIRNQRIEVTYLTPIFSLKAIYDSNTAKMEYEKSDIDEEELYNEVYKNFGFLVEANVNRKPLINMQKEFNKKYYKRFN